MSATAAPSTWTLPESLANHARLSGVSGTYKAVSELSALADQLEGKSGKGASGDMHKSAGESRAQCPHCRALNALAGRELV